jgi:hypothetical protein
MFAIGSSEIGALLGLLIFFGLGLASTAFWIWMIVDCATKEPSEGNDKLIWLLVIVLAGVVGAIIYYFVRRAPRIANAGP